MSARKDQTPNFYKKSTENVKVTSTNNKVINMGQIIKHIGHGERAYIAGEQVLNANHLLLCRYLQRNNVQLIIFALCLKSSAIRDATHELKFFINKEKQIR